MILLLCILSVLIGVAICLWYGNSRRPVIERYVKFTEKYPEKVEDFSPAQVHAAGQLGQDIPLVEAAVQQAQSYASAYRLAELYAQTLTSERVKKEQIRNNVLPAFKTVENMVSSMMMGSNDLEFASQNTGQELPDQIAKVICNELMESFKYYNEIP